MNIRYKTGFSMGHSRLTTLSLILRKLSAHEIDVLKRFLKVFELRSEREPKTLTLLHLLLQEEDMEALYQKLPQALDAPSDDAIRMVIHRLHEKINETLVMVVNTNRANAYDNLTKAKFDTTHKLMIVDIYYGRGLKKEALSTLNKIITTAKKYELYTELVSALAYKQRILSLTKGRKAFDEYQHEIDFYEGARTAANNAKLAYYHTIQNYAFKGHNRNTTDDSYLIALNEALEKLQADVVMYSSPIVNFYYHLLKIESLQVQHRYDKASEYCLNSIKIIRNNPSVFLKRRIGIANLNLSQNEIYNGYYDYSKGFAAEARQYFRPDTNNYFLSYELEFYANFYSGNIDEASRIIELLKANPAAHTSDFRKSWMHYLSACIAFIKGDFKAIPPLLNNALKVNTDKEGWNIGVRMLNILTALEKGQNDLADNQILSLQQFIKQGIKGIEVRRRDEVILKILVGLRKESYRYGVVATKFREELELLESEDRELSWQVLAPELIVFHKWFEAKYNNEAYPVINDAVAERRLSE